VVRHSHNRGKAAAMETGAAVDEQQQARRLRSVGGARRPKP
jgi:hypothetical protein